MLIVFHGIDHPNSAALRASTRPAHLEFQSQRQNLFGGPLRDGNGDICGSVIVFEAPNVDAATADLADDPYLRVGLFQHVSITEFVGEWPSASATTTTM